MGRGLFITGTDTGVGKTLVTLALMRAFTAAGLRVNGMKPVASGSEVTHDGLRNSDALLIQQAATMPLSYLDVNPYAFGPAIAPHIAARLANEIIDIEVLRARYEHLSSLADITIVEGAGGWRTPLGHGTALSDFPESLEMDVVLTVGLRLGCLNHAQLTAEAIYWNARCRLLGWVANSIDPDYLYVEENIETLREALNSPCLGVIPCLNQPTAIDAAAHLDISALRIA